MTDNESRDTPEPPSTLKTVLLLELMALLIGLAMPITPSKTGSDASLAELFIGDPGYLQEAFIYFVLTNLLVGLLILASWVWNRVKKPAAGVTDGSGTGSGTGTPSGMSN